MSTFGVGVSALTAAQAGLTTTSHNISNVNTPGFHRQQIVQSTKIPQFFGIGFLGQGTQVETVKRLYNELLDSQVTQAQTLSSQLDSYYSQIRQIDNMLADPNAGLSPALQDFFNGVQDVAANPSSIPSRQAMLSSGQSMVSRFQSINQRFSEIRDGVNSEIRSTLGTINTYAQQIANMNKQIGLAQSSTGELQPANDLLDQRDQLLVELNMLVKVSTVKQSDGSLSVFVGNGQTLVINNQSFALAAVPSLEDPERIEVGLMTAGNAVLLSQGSLQGGSLGGILAFRNETLDAAQNQLGRVALGLAQTFNDQHNLGVDLQGAMGTSFFNVPPPKVIPNAGNPAGTASPTVTFNNVAAVTTNDYRLSYNGTNWGLMDTTTGLAVAMAGAGTLASPYLADGLSIVVPTTAPSGPVSFLIRPTINGARDVSVRLTDPAKIAAAAPFRTEATLSNTGSGRISAGAVNSFNDKVVFTFTSASAFDVVDTTSGVTLAKNVTYTPGGDISYNGWTVKIANGAGPTTPVAGDTFTIDHTVASTTSTTATIAQPTLASPPVDPFLSNAVRVVFDTPTTYHLEGQTNNITGTSTIVGGAVAPTQGKAVGSAAVGSTTIVAGTNDTLNITVDGLASTLTLTAGVYATPAALATQIALDITGAGIAATVTQAAGVFTLTSNSYGSSSTVNVTGGNGMANLLGTPVSTAGANPVGTAASGAVTVGTGGSTVAGGLGAYTSTGVKTTISGGTVTGTGPFTLTGATITLEGGSYAGSTTFSGVTVSITAAGDISIAAVGAGGTASTFNGRPATGNVYNPAGNNHVSVNGWTVDITGIPSTGDTFTVTRNSGGVSDNRNALLLAGLQTQNTLAGGTVSYQSAYSQLVSMVGNKTHELDVTSKAQASLLAQTQQVQQSLSGVNLDEEAANLMRYQQAYQAAGKMMQIASTLFDTLLSLGD